MEQQPFNVSAPSHARIYDYLLGGKDNYAVDRQAAEAVLADWPELVQNARANRAWESRVVLQLATEGVDQFLDVGSGLPTADNVHQVAQRVNPDARVLYVDNDPIVLALGRALLVEDERTAYLEADARDAPTILDCAETFLDRSRPIGLLLAGVLHYVPGDLGDVTAPYLEWLPPGSYVAISHAASEGADSAVVRQLSEQYGELLLRSAEEIRRAFEGSQIQEPGVLVDARRWRREDDVEVGPLPLLAGLGKVS